MKYKIKALPCLFSFLVSISFTNAQESKDYTKSLSLQGATFNLRATNHGSINNLSIVGEYSGHKIFENQREIEGTVTGAEIADLNSDGSPEIYIYLTSAGSGSYGSVIAYSMNKKHTATEIYMSNISENSKLSKGYMGHDEFSILENRLGRRFPLYLPGDINSKPSGGIRQLEYKLIPGEASWLLKVSKQTDIK
jgi:hypothetical protein